MNRTMIDFHYAPIKPPLPSKAEAMITGEILREIEDRRGDGLIDRIAEIEAFGAEYRRRMARVTLGLKAKQT